MIITMKENNIKSHIFVKIATIILLACTNQTFNDSDKLGTSLVKNATSNGEFDLRTQRLLGESRSSRDSLLLDSFYDDDDELFDYDADHKPKRDVKDKHHRHRHSQRHKHQHSHRHSTSRSKREEKKKDDDDVLSLSQFNMDEDDDDDENVEESILSRLRSNDYDDIINLTNARRSNSKHRISSMDTDLRSGHDDDLIVKRRKRSSGVTRKSDSYGDKKIHDTLSSLDEFRDYHWEERRARKKSTNNKVAKIFGILGAVAVSHKLMGFFLTTGNVAALPLAVSVCVLGGLLYRKSKSKNRYRRPPPRSITY